MDFGNYVQIIKTTDAELRGYKNLAPEVKASILPLFELTRSRSTKIVPDGDIRRRITNIKESVEGRFILDLTSHESLINHQIEDLLDDANGFLSWTNFVIELETPGLIPAIHVYEDSDPENIKTQVISLCNAFECVAFRVPADDRNLDFYLRNIVPSLKSESQLLVIIDAELITSSDFARKHEFIENKIKFIRRQYPDISLCCSASSFPQYVVNLDGCEDEYGEFPILEWSLFLGLKTRYENLIYGDYGSVHPVRYQSRGGSWVPRIDYPLTETIIYSRFRRHVGGYEECAVELVDNTAFDRIPCWGTDQIIEASEGNPNGKSPSFWIAARINIHSTRKVQDLYELYFGLL